jgi:hypothetical protein
VFSVADQLIPNGEHRNAYVSAVPMSSSDPPKNGNFIGYNAKILFAPLSHVIATLPPFGVNGRPVTPVSR